MQWEGQFEKEFFKEAWPSLGWGVSAPLANVPWAVIGGQSSLKKWLCYSNPRAWNGPQSLQSSTCWPLVLLSLSKAPYLQTKRLQLVLTDSGVLFHSLLLVDDGILGVLGHFLGLHTIHTMLVMTSALFNLTPKAVLPLQVHFWCFLKVLSKSATCLGQKQRRTTS